MVLHVGKKIQFSMIANEELEPLRQYISTRTFGAAASSAKAAQTPGPASGAASGAAAADAPAEGQAITPPNTKTAAALAAAAAAAAPGEPADTKFLRTRIRQDMVDAAARLLKASSASVLRGLQ